jgi:hypothetical protein
VVRQTATRGRRAGSRQAPFAFQGKEKPMNQYYVLVAWGCVEIELVGPFETEELRDKRARELRKESDTNDGVWALDLIDGKPTVGDYSGGFFMEDENNEA